MSCSSRNNCFDTNLHMYVPSSIELHRQRARGRGGRCGTTEGENGIVLSNVCAIMLSRATLWIPARQILGKVGQSLSIILHMICKLCTQSPHTTQCSRQFSHTYTHTNTRTYTHTHPYYSYINVLWCIYYVLDICMERALRCMYENEIGIFPPCIAKCAKVNEQRSMHRCATSTAHWVCRANDGCRCTPLYLNIIMHFEMPPYSTTTPIIPDEIIGAKFGARPTVRCCCEQVK